ADFGPTQVSLGNIPLAATVTLAGSGPWVLTKLSPESPTPIDELEFDSSQTDAVPLVLRIRDDAATGVYGLLDARIRVRGRAVVTPTQPPGNTSQPSESVQPTRPGDPRSDASSPPLGLVTGLEAPLAPGWLIVQCYCWRGEGVALPSINLREARGDWSYSFTPDPGQPVVFTDLPTDVAMIVELVDKTGAFSGQPTRWDEIYLASRGATIYFVVGP
ncbi:MAG: hypothetical protein ACKVVP_08120, partial [Chloroflexota bacterium]